MLVPAVAPAKTRNIDVPKKFEALLVAAKEKTRGRTTRAR
jgi:hypothetical protein